MKARSRRLVGNICDEDRAHRHIPDDAIRLEGDVVVVRNRGTLPKPPDKRGERRSLVLGAFQPDDATWQDARAAAPGWDIHGLLADWKAWALGRERLPRDLGKAFVGFCKKKGPYR